MNADGWIVGLMDCGHVKNADWGHEPMFEDENEDEVLWPGPHNQH
jgi:hypothetical protein